MGFERVFFLKQGTGTGFSGSKLIPNIRQPGGEPAFCAQLAAEIGEILWRFPLTTFWSPQHTFLQLFSGVIEDFLLKICRTQRKEMTPLVMRERMLTRRSSPHLEVLKRALIEDGLARGIHECAKALDKRQALMCVLAKNCDEPMYVKLVEALCKEHGINLIRVDDNKKLGEWVGLCKIDKEGKPRKVVRCSCVVVKDYGKQTPAHEMLQKYFKSQRGGGEASDTEDND
ncbi:putative 40S ribosomal protein S12 [Hypsibius exemplaris]|uniref:40S ribosomal protein S12 n=1 Tax=Hypsibius exemplaris TaxID=2072580 RepID=A0A1W0WDF9_HYPEX|nr:putative 40S ribosomal protein S12 [Hypsibius exemplaris]